MWGMAFVATRCAGSLVGMAEWGGGLWVGVCSILAIRLPLPHSPTPYGASLSPVSAPTLIQRCFLSPVWSPLRGEAGEVNSPFSALSFLLLLSGAPAPPSSSWCFCSHLVLLFLPHFLPADVTDPLSHPSLQAAGQMGRCRP